MGPQRRRRARIAVPPNRANATRTSLFLSLVLRHKPETIGLRLDRQGWIEVGELLPVLDRAGHSLTFAELAQIVETNDKQRFAFNAARTEIHAVQGHSTAVELGYTPVAPPSVLYHGTVERFLPAILAEGLKRGQRHQVHLSAVRGRRCRPAPGSLSCSEYDPILVSIVGLRSSTAGDA
jgi:putative RNA 2'-phosphotransferase